MTDKASKAEWERIFAEIDWKQQMKEWAEEHFLYGPCYNGDRDDI